MNEPCDNCTKLLSRVSELLGEIDRLKDGISVRNRSIDRLNAEAMTLEQHTERFRKMLEQARERGGE